MLNLFEKLKFPIIKQYDQTDCGAACHLSVLKYYKGNDNIVHVRELCNVDKSGSRMIDVVNAAEQLGFEAFGATGTYNDLLKEDMPFIAHVLIEEKLNHYVVVYKIRESKILVGDPGKGLHWMRREEFEKIWANHAVILLKTNEQVYNQKQETNIQWMAKYLTKNNS